MEAKTIVVFLIEKESNDVFAFFPREDYYRYKSDTKTCYAHIGQHSACSMEYAKECKLATKNEYKDLEIELKSIGYDLYIQKVF